MTLTARHFRTGESIALTIVDGVITNIEPSERPATNLWIAPSFFDVQINGCLGIGFNSPTLNPDGVRIVANKCRQHGIGRFCPTVITDSFESIRNGFEVLTEARNADAELAWRLPAFHLEGPYLSELDGPRGAHPKAHIRDPNWDEFRRWQDAAAGCIRMTTIAPERAGALRYIERLTAEGVVVALGHTAATASQIRAAVTAGARISTHLGNGYFAQMPRHDNVIWEQLANDGLWASLIADGHHLPPAVVKSLVRAKTPSRILLTCDASTLAGLPPGRYADWGAELEVLPGGKVVIPGTPYLAGSGLFTDTCVTNVVRMAGVTLADAIDMASIRPRQLMGLPVPDLAVGAKAEFVLFDREDCGDIVVKKTMG